eukprot:403371875
MSHIINPSQSGKQQSQQKYQQHIGFKGQNGPYLVKGDIIPESQISIRDVYRNQSDKVRNQQYDRNTLNQKFHKLQKNLEDEDNSDSEMIDGKNQGADVYEKPESEMSYNTQMCMDLDAPVPDDEEIEKHLDHYQYDDVMTGPLLNRKKQKRLRPQQIQKQQFKEFTQMYRNSNEYKEWLEYINDHKANKPSVCLTCWQFVSEQQKNMHLAYGHISIDKNQVTSEARFVHYAKVWKKLTWDDIVFIFAPQVGEHFDRRNMQIINMLSHDMKSCRENKGNIKGQPPYLCSPLVPFNMVPPSISALAIIQRIEKEKQLHAIAHQEILAIEEDKEGVNFSERQKLQFGEFVKGYTNDNRNALCRILQQIGSDIHYIIKAQDDMLHKINLLLVKKGRIVYQKPGYSTESQQEVLEQTIDQVRANYQPTQPNLSQSQSVLDPKSTQYFNQTQDYEKLPNFNINYPIIGQPYNPTQQPQLNIINGNLDPEHQDIINNKAAIRLRVQEQSTSSFLGADYGAESGRDTEIQNCYRQLDSNQEMDLEDYLENSALREVVDPLFNGQYYDQKPAYRSLREDTIRIGSEEFKEFVLRLEIIMKKRIGNHYICLFCWKFVSLMQQKQHQRVGHQCAKECSIRDEKSFMEVSRTFGKISLNGCVQKFGAFERNNFVKHSKLKNGFSVPMKDFYKNQIIMNEKGRPPCLSPPMTPLNMVPYNNGSNWNFQNNRNHDEEISNHLSGGQQHFDNQNRPIADPDDIKVKLDKELVVNSIAKIHKRINETEDMLIEMIHKVRLIAIQDESKYPEYVQYNESLVQLMQIKQNRLQLCKWFENQRINQEKLATVLEVMFRGYTPGGAYIPKKKGRNAYAAGLAAMYKKISGEDASYNPPRMYDPDFNINGDDDESALPDPDYLDNNTFDPGAMGLELQNSQLQNNQGQPVNNGFNKYDWVRIGSTEYYVFIKQMQEQITKNKKDQQVCLTCWRFISYNRKKVHEQQNHTCAAASLIKEDSSFLQIAKTYGRFTAEGWVQKFLPRDRAHLQNDAFLAPNAQQNPIISDPLNQSKKTTLCPLNMIPFNDFKQAPNNNAVNSDPTSTDKPAAWRTFKYTGSINMSFDQQEKEKLLMALNTFKLRMNSIEDRMGEMAHHLTTMMDRFNRRKEYNESQYMAQQILTQGKIVDELGEGIEGVEDQLNGLRQQQEFVDIEMNDDIFEEDFLDFKDELQFAN